MTRDQFIKQCENLNGTLTAREVRSIRPCECGSASCNGWHVNIIPKQDSFALAGQMPVVIV